MKRGPKTEGIQRIKEKLCKFNKEECIKIVGLYKTMSATEIGKIFGVGAQTIQTALKLENVQIRNMKEAQNLYLNNHNERSEKQSEFMKKNNPMFKEEIRKNVTKGLLKYYKKHPHTLQHKIKLSLARTKEKEFTGFKVSQVTKIRKSDRYKEWRKNVFERDKYTCQITGKRSVGDIISHHIKSFSNNPDLRFEVNNGFTMGKELHNKFHKTYGYGNNTRRQLEEFKLNIQNI